MQLLFLVDGCRVQAAKSDGELPAILRNGLPVFSNVAYSTCQRHPVCGPGHLYAVNAHDSVAGSDYNERRIHSAGLVSCFAIRIVACSCVYEIDTFVKVCCKFWKGLFLCPKSVSVQTVLARFFCLCDRFL